MDPSIFFGRTRPTRQTLKSKQETTSKDTENCEVKKDVPRVTRRQQVQNQKPSGTAEKENNRKTRLGTAGKENEVETEPTTKRTSKRTKQPVKTNDQNGVQGNSKPAKKPQKVQFDEPDDGPSQESPKGPVYLNVRRSDVMGDPYEEYDFPCGSDSSPEKNSKKKKKAPRKAKPAKKAGGIVMWDPSKRPINVKCKPTKKTAVQVNSAVTDTAPIKTVKRQLPTSEPSKLTCSSEKTVVNPIKANMPVSSKLQVVPGPTNSNKNGTTSVSKGPPLKKAPSVAATSKPVKEVLGATDPGLNGTKCFTSTPVSNRPVLKKVPSVAASSRALNASLGTAAAQAPSVPSLVVSHVPDESCQPMSPSIVADFHCESTPTSSSPNLTSVNARSSLKVTPAQVAARQSSSLPLLKLAVRESPSFGESNEAYNSPLRPSPSISEIEVPKNLDAVTSTPVTRSRKNNGALKSTAVNFNEPAVIRKVSVALENNSDRNLSGIFDDIPRTSVVPTRMFSNHRGTIYIPESQNAPKRKMPEISPIKEQSSSQFVESPAPQASLGLEQCFGFEEVDEDAARPINNNVNVAKQVRKPFMLARKPSLSIEEAQAILRGHCKLASPASITPKSIQTKLTDFVSSTPARVVPISNKDALTPTPVPLFDEDQLEREFPSPFSQVSILKFFLSFSF